MQLSPQYMWAVISTYNHASMEEQSPHTLGVIKSDNTDAQIYLTLGFQDWGLGFTKLIQGLGFRF